MHLRRQLSRVDLDLQRIEREREDLDSLQQQRKITLPEWGSRIEKHILPELVAAEDRIADGQAVEDAKLGKARTELVDFIDHERFALDLLGEAAITADADKREWGTNMMRTVMAQEDGVLATVRAEE